MHTIEMIGRQNRLIGWHFLRGIDAIRIFYYVEGAVTIENTKDYHLSLIAFLGGVILVAILFEEWVSEPETVLCGPVSLTIDAF